MITTDKCIVTIRLLYSCNLSTTFIFSPPPLPYIKTIDLVRIILLRITSSLSAVNISASARVTWWASSGNTLNVTSGPYKYLPVVYTIVLSIFPVDFCCLKPNCNIYGILIFIKRKNSIHQQYKKIWIYNKYNASTKHTWKCIICVTCYQWTGWNTLLAKYLIGSSK